MCFKFSTKFCLTFSPSDPVKAASDSLRLHTCNFYFSSPLFNEFQDVTKGFFFWWEESQLREIRKGETPDLNILMSFH